ncbi:hypothetical protein BV20DRAFT_348735 [Pilatotrama ljubarskyi]|nr:hypothetical protein BV20DRAFT_348735 [Pilatotrama ljubarskyi]
MYNTITARDRRDGPVTPTPPPGREDTAGLSFKIGQPVKLLYTLNDQFVRGDIVEIYNYEPQPQSATTRPGQSSEWTIKTDANTVYRFQKQVVTNHDTEVISDASGALAVHHSSLALSPNGQPAGIQYMAETKVYTLRAIETTPSSRQPKYIVPAGTQGRILKFTTRSGGPRYAKLDTVDPKKRYYMVQFKLRQARWETIPCVQKKEHSNFRALTAEEKAEYDAYLAKRLPAPKFVDWDA